MNTFKFYLLKPASGIFRAALAGATMDYYFKYAEYLDPEKSEGFYAVISTINGYDYTIETVDYKDKVVNSVATRIAETAVPDATIEIEGIDTVTMMQKIYDKRSTILASRNIDRISDLSFICNTTDSPTVISYRRE